MIRNLLLLLVVLLAGCAEKPEPIAMDQATRQALNALQQVRVVQYEPPNFEVPPIVNPLLLGGIGAVISELEKDTRSRKMVEEYGLTDPIIQIKRELVPFVQEKITQAALSEVTYPLKDDDLGKLKKEYRQGYLIDLKTIHWKLGYNPYQDYSSVFYHSRARLLSISDEKILWQGVCEREEKDTVLKPSQEEFEANKGALLKEYLTRVATACANELKKQFMGTDSPKPDSAVSRIERRHSDAN